MNEDFQSNQTYIDIISLILVSLMMVCIGISITQVGQRVMPGWDFWILPVLSFLAAFERMITYKQADRLVQFSKSWLIFQVTQWIVILIIIKTVLLISFPPESWIVEIQLWRIDFFEYFFDIPFIYTLFFVFLIWMVSGYFAHLLNEMSLNEAMVRYETAITVPVDETPVRERLLSTIFLIGFILLVITAVLRINLRMLLEEGFGSGELIQPLPYMASGSWNVLLYFIFGLSLMSLSQFVRLNARWSFQKIPVIPKLANKWATYSIGFILLVAIATSILPTSYSMGLLSSIAQVLTIIYGFFVFIVSFIFSILIFFFGVLANLLGIDTIRQEEQIPPEFIIPEMPPQVQIPGVSPWLDLVKSLIFWFVFIGLVGFSIYTFFRQHGEFLKTMSKVKIIAWLRGIWISLRELISGVKRQITTAIDSGLEGFRSRRKLQKRVSFKGPIRYPRFNNRQRILFTFFRMLRSSSHKGIERGKSKTPYEFAQQLENNIPDAKEEIKVITNEFVKARYSKESIDDERVNLTRRSWAKIRNALSMIRK